MTPRPARLAVASLVVAGFLSLTPRASAGFVDTFDSPTPATYYQILGDPRGGPQTPSPYTLSTPLGGGVTRDVTVTVVSPTPPGPNSVSGDIGGGIFSMDTNNNSVVTADIKYTLTGSAGNLTGVTAVELDFNNFDAGTGASSTPVTVSITTTSGTQTVTKLVTESKTAFTESFAIPSLAGDVQSIKITLNSNSPFDPRASLQTAVDFSLDTVRVKGSTNIPGVPAPPALLLAGFGVLALVGRARFTRAK